ncbi:calmodulin-4 [Phtheirospermum japonicum]|uniref:Calmodulin-4 n=1 Tax=Phtheirospermum japonicum TaxID=374723 RepID=A0A830BLK0_9LAMI|nr:calmodulin-4 [Phtheirospermum japonicum]
MARKMKYTDPRSSKGIFCAYDKGSKRFYLGCRAVSCDDEPRREADRQGGEGDD